MQLKEDYKQKVRKELLGKRKLSNQSDKRFAISMGLNASTYSRLKKGEIDRVISEEKWLELGRELDVILDKRVWKIAHTQMYNELGKLIKESKSNGLSYILVDRCGWGKSESARMISKNTPNVIYIDCSQVKKKLLFIRTLAQKIGLDNRGKIDDILSKLKYYLKLMDKPMVILDEFGDLDNATILLIKELWNETEGFVAWLAMGAEGLESKITKGISSKKVGFAELYSRFASEYVQITPEDPIRFEEYKRIEFEAIAKANLRDKTKINRVVKKAMTGDKDIRFLKNLITLNDY